MNWKNRYNGFKVGDKVKIIEEKRGTACIGKTGFIKSGIGNHTLTIKAVDSNGYFQLINYLPLNYNPECFEKVIT